MHRRQWKRTKTSSKSKNRPISGQVRKSAWKRMTVIVYDIRIISEGIGNRGQHLFSCVDFLVFLNDPISDQLRLANTKVLDTICPIFFLSWCEYIVTVKKRPDVTCALNLRVYRSSWIVELMMACPSCALSLCLLFHVHCICMPSFMRNIFLISKFIAFPHVRYAPMSDLVAFPHAHFPWWVM